MAKQIAKKLLVVAALAALVACACAPFALANEVAQSQSQTGPQANSWRYVNGELVSSKEGANTDSLLDAAELAELQGVDAVSGWVFNDFDQFDVGLYTGTDALKGIDVSSHQSYIDWTKVKAAGIDYAIIRCGYGDDERGQDDSYFAQNVRGCIANNIPFGIYVYSHADWDGADYVAYHAQSEAQHCLTCLSQVGISPSDLAYPIYLDLEESRLRDNPGWNTVAWNTFKTVIQNAGGKPGIYASQSWWTGAQLAGITDCNYKWVAAWNIGGREGLGLQYCGSSDFKTSQAVWQFSDAGIVNGISGVVDLNYTYLEPAIDMSSKYVEVDTQNNKMTLRADVTGLDLSQWDNKIYVDGKAYAATISNNLLSATVNGTSASSAVIYTYNNISASDVHTIYPEHMYVWLFGSRYGRPTLSRASSFDDILTYESCAIRIVGTKGLRVMTSMKQSVKADLIGNGYQGYTLQESGTLVYKGLDRGITFDNTTMSGAAYKRGAYDKVFKVVDGRSYFTNVLVPSAGSDFTAEQCSMDLSLRPYLRLKDSQGNTFVLYGGTVQKSIYSIAKQYLSLYRENSDEYKYVNNIVQSVEALKEQ